jgi:hypothetical protein
MLVKIKDGKERYSEHADILLSDIRLSDMILILILKERVELGAKVAGL